MSSKSKRSKKGKRKGKQKAEPVLVQELEEPKEMEDEVPGEIFIAHVVVLGSELRTVNVKAS